jgi:hypothetical protein
MADRGCPTQAVACCGDLCGGGADVDDLESSELAAAFHRAACRDRSQLMVERSRHAGIGFDRYLCRAAPQRDDAAANRD